MKIIKNGLNDKTSTLLQSLLHQGISIKIY